MRKILLNDGKVMDFGPAARGMKPLPKRIPRVSHITYPRGKILNMAATQKPKKAELHEKVYRVIAPLPFHAYSQQGLERENARLQKFVFKLERKFHETIWYIGMDMFGKEIYERFVFNHGGFMEIRLGESLLEAFFDNAHSAEKFKNALARVLCKFDAPGCARRIEVKEEFINLGRLLGLGEKEKRGKR